MAATVCLAAQNKAALEHFVQTPVSREMIQYLAEKASGVIRCDPTPGRDKNLPPTPPATPPQDGSSPVRDQGVPTLEEFIQSLVTQSHVQTYTLMPSLVYLARLQQRLPPTASGMSCSGHRIFLAALILAAKYLNDSSPKNKYWARYTKVPGYETWGWDTSDVTLMEKQLLNLLDWDLRITNDDLYIHLEPFLAPVRIWQQQRAEQQMLKLQRERELKEQQLQQQYEASLILPPARMHTLPAAVIANASGTVYDSPRSLRSTSSTYSVRPRNFTSRSSSRAPTRTPSLSPPTRSTSAMSGSASSSYAASPASLLDVSYLEQGESVRIQSLDVEPTVVHIRSSSKLAHELAMPVEELKPAKKLKAGAMGVFSRFLSGSYGLKPVVAAHDPASDDRMVGVVHTLA